MKGPFSKISFGMNFLCSNQVYVAWSCFSLTWVLLVIRAIKVGDYNCHLCCFQLHFSRLKKDNYFKELG